ncbi:hypothetical protein FHG87_009056 [Trinorchestia longiramus]|nr:hypothetical protein FHG87_009056 [Trinorchestia longiramus]
MYMYHQLGRLVSESACERKDPGSNPAADMVDAARNTAWDLVINTPSSRLDNIDEDSRVNNLYWCGGVSGVTTILTTSNLATSCTSSQAHFIILSHDGVESCVVRVCGGAGGYGG